VKLYIRTYTHTYMHTAGEIMSCAPSQTWSVCKLCMCCNVQWHDFCPYCVYGFHFVSTITLRVTELLFKNWWPHIFKARTSSCRTRGLFTVLTRRLHWIQASHISSLHNPYTERLQDLFLGAFAKLRKATYFRHVWPSIHAPGSPYRTTRLLLYGFSWILIFEYFSKILPENSGLIKIWVECRIFYMKTSIHLSPSLLLKMRMFLTEVV
jgi:hypothetical protein